MIPNLRRYLAVRSLARIDADPILSEYASRRFRTPRSTPIADVRFVVFDTEATGLDLDTNRMLSLAAVAVRGGEIDLSDRLELTFASDDVGGRHAAEIHQMVLADVRDGLSEEIGALRFLAYLKDSILVAHHVGFDVAMINKVLKRMGPVRLYNRCLDTLALDRRLTHGPHQRDDHHRDEDRSLDGLCNKFDLDISFRHSAAGDALATGQLLLKLLACARKRGIATLGALMKS